jgi:hypothetical protein
LCPVKQFHTAIACEGELASLTCKKGGGRIHLLEARYGREKRWICGNLDFWDYNCKLSPHNKGITLTTPICEGKVECKVPATDKLFGDPCKMTYKYVEIMYQCYGGRYPDLAGDEEYYPDMLE